MRRAQLPESTAFPTIHRHRASSRQLLPKASPICLTFFRAFVKPAWSPVPVCPLILDQSAPLVVEELKEAETSVTSVEKLMAFAPVDRGRPACLNSEAVAI